MKQILVTAYVSPDLDGVAGAIAYSEFLQKTGVDTVAGFMGDIHDEAKYVFDRFKIQYPIVNINPDNYKNVILVDASDLNGLEGKISPDKIIEIIDHRKIHEAEKFPNAKVQIELVGAAATLVAEKFMNENVPISIESAILLLSAIISNTLNFKGTVAVERDRTVAIWLNQYVKLPDSYAEELFVAKSDLTGEILRRRLEDDFAHFLIKDKVFGIGQIEMIGGRKLVQERESEILELLEGQKEKLNLKFAFLSIIDLKENINLFFTKDKEAKQLLEKIFNFSFIGNIAERPGMIMRKQIIPLFKEIIEQ